MKDKFDAQWDLLRTEYDVTLRNTELVFVRDDRIAIITISDRQLSKIGSESDPISHRCDLSMTPVQGISG